MQARSRPHKVGDSLHAASQPGVGSPPSSPRPGGGNGEGPSLFAREKKEAIGARIAAQHCIINSNVMVGLRQTLLLLPWERTPHWSHLSWSVMPSQLLNMHEIAKGDPRHDIPLWTFTGKAIQATRANDRMLFRTVLYKNDLATIKRWLGIRASRHRSGAFPPLQVCLRVLYM